MVKTINKFKIKRYKKIVHQKKPIIKITIKYDE